MTEGTQTTYEEAQRCPKCGQPGNARKKEPLLGSGGKWLHHIYCENQRCEWYNTPWLVQVNADGSVPPPQDHTKSPKEYMGFEHDAELAERVLANLASLEEIQTQRGGHGEIANPQA